MAELLEGVDFPDPDKEEITKCPFVEVCEDTPEIEGEGIAYDDLDSVAEAQENDGGVLGRNLASKPQSPGKQSTLNSLYPWGGSQEPDLPRDTKRNDGGKVNVGGEEFPYGVAAHHCIPGNGSLTSSEIYQYMAKDSTVQDATGKSWTMKYHIGYNVNGAHNGVWLPGNYAVREGKTTKQSTWSELMITDRDWCRRYVVALVKKKLVQFHDTHAEYNDTLKDVLDKVKTALLQHQVVCAAAGGPCKADKVPPPFRLKKRLYTLSAWLRGQLAGAPQVWKVPFVTSDQWKAELLNPVSKSQFQQAYEEANP
jgi:hypothetical protein